MKKSSKIMIALGSSLLSISAAHASVPNHSDPTTFLGPTLRLGLTSPLSDITAYSLAGEVGFKNFRVGATMAWRLRQEQRLKLSAEYLWQDLTYPFFSGNTNRWVTQFAIGGDYEYLLADYTASPSLVLSGYYSRAASSSLGTVTGVFVNSVGGVQRFINNRRIAGANAGGLAPGMTMHPWSGGKVGVDLNWDDVSYDKHYYPNQNSNGFGGTFRMSQVILDNVVIGGSAAIREPFNNYAANLGWTNLPFYGLWTLGLNGEYTTGKNSLPNSYNIGLSADYFLDQGCTTAAAQKEAANRFVNPRRDYKGEALVPVMPANDFLPWTAEPAVYMPTVLAVQDESVAYPPLD